MRVAQEHRAPGADIVEELVAIRVVKILAASLFNDQRVAADRAKGAHGAVYAADEKFRGVIENFTGTAAVTLQG